MSRRGERPGHSATTAHFQAAYPFLGQGGLGAPGVYIGTDAFGGAWAFDPWELAAGSVTSVKLATGAVNHWSIRKKAVTSNRLAFGSLTRVAIAPGSVYSEALAPETIHSAPISDLDAVAHNGEWTASNAEDVLCGPGEALLGTGFGFTNPGTREVSFLQALPFLAGTGDGVSGRISSYSGGGGTAEVVAICLGS